MADAGDDEWTPGADSGPADVLLIDDFDAMSE
jgi:hypothetical protein